MFLESINIFFKCSFELFLNFHFKNFWLPWGWNLTRAVDPRARGQVVRYQANANAKFQFIFWNTTGGNFSFETYRQLILHFFTIHTPAHVKPSKLQKWVFHHYKTWERKLVSMYMFFEKVRLSKGKLETDDTKLPKKEKFRVISKDEYK